MGALFLVVITLVVGFVILYLIVSPTLLNVRRHNEPLVIPLAEISPIWTMHNVEMAPLSAEETENTGQGDILDAMWNTTEATPAAEEPEAQPTAAPAVPTLQAAPRELKPAGKPPERPPWEKWEQGKAAAAAKAQEAPQPAEKTTEKLPEKPVEKPVAKTEAAPAAKAEQQPPAVGLSLSALVGPLKSLYDDCIVPYKKVLKSQGAEEIVRDLLRLIEDHGHCPSVVIDSKDEESLDMITVRDNLVKVTLKDHTFAVCRYMIGNLKSTFQDYEIMIPSALVIALAHDIGKIPEFRMSGAYNSRDHARVGADKLAEMMEGSSAVWVKKAIKAVNGHHSPTREDMTALLKQSDRQARQAELAVCTRAYTVKPFQEWFDLKKYLTNYVAPGVNATQTGKWNAFSFRGTIYAKPDWLYEQARKMCHDEKILDLMFIYTSEKDNAIRVVVSAMRRENITPLLGENYPARKFEVRTSVEVKRLPAFFLTAFMVPDYINIMEIESRKSGFTEIIDAVTPA